MTEEAGTFGKPAALGREQRRHTKITIKSVDLKDEMQKVAVDFALAAFEKHNVEKHIAAYIKKEFDRMYGPTWHCIVGHNFVWGLG